MGPTLPPTHTHTLDSGVCSSKRWAGIKAIAIPALALLPSRCSVEAFVQRCTEIANLTAGNDIMLVFGSGEWAALAAAHAVSQALLLLSLTSE